MGEMTNSGSTRQNGRISYLGEGTLGENTEIEVSTTGTTETGRAWQAVDGQMGDGRWQMKQAIDRQMIAGAVAAEEAAEAAGGGVATHINRHVFPQAPSPTMTSFRRSSAILEDVGCEMKG